MKVALGMVFALLVIPNLVHARLPDRLKCSDPTNSVYLDSQSISKIGATDKLQAFELDITVLDKNVLKRISTCPSCEEEIFSAKLNVRRTNGSNLSAPLGELKSDGSIDILLICHQDLSRYPEPVINE